MWPTLFANAIGSQQSSARCLKVPERVQLPSLRVLDCALQTQRRRGPAAVGRGQERPPPQQQAQQRPRWQALLGGFFRFSAPVRVPPLLLRSRLRRLRGQRGLRLLVERP